MSRLTVAVQGVGVQKDAMGVCRCRRRTSLFCFVHSKAVCAECLEDHANCFINSYIEWLTNSAFDPPACPHCKRDVSSPSERPLRLECLHLHHEDCLGRALSALPSASPASDYCCTVCRHPVAPDKWPLAAGPGARIAAFLRRYPFGAKLLPTAPLAVVAPTGSAPSTPLRAAIMGAATGDVKTPKARSRKQGDGGDVRLTVEDQQDEDKCGTRLVFQALVGEV